MLARKLVQIDSFVKEQKSTISLGLMIMFWTLYEGIILFVTPIIITDKGYSNTEMGLLYSCSSLFGILFDFLFIFLLKKIYYRRMLLIALLMGCFYSFLLWRSSTFLVFLSCMAFWGLYTDMFNFGLDDFSGRFHNYNQNAKSLSLLVVFRSIGYIFSPLITGSLLNAHISPQFYAFFFVVISLIFFKIFLTISKKDKLISNHLEITHIVWNKKNFSLWLKTFSRLWPILIFTFLLYLHDACFWTIGPLLSETYSDFPNFGALFLTFSMLPGLFMIYVVPKLVKKFGKKRTGHLSFLFSLLLLLAIVIFDNPIIILIFIFISSFIGYCAYPATKSAFADYLEESKKSDCMIMGFEDIFINLGYIVGPALIGSLSDKVGNLPALAMITLISAFLVVILMLLTPKKISFKGM